MFHWQIRLPIRGLALFVATMLAGCSLTPPTREGFERPLGSGWQAQGRIAIQTQDDNVVLKFLWKHENTMDHVRLYGSLGKTYADLKVRHEEAVLVTDDATYRDTSAENLLRRVLGWSVPVKLAAQWLRGQPYDEADTSVRQELDQQGNLKQLDVVSWQISYLRYGRFDGQRLPTRVNMVGPDTVLKISIHQWQNGK